MDVSLEICKCKRCSQTLCTYFANTFLSTANISVTAIYRLLSTPQNSVHHMADFALDISQAYPAVCYTSYRRLHWLHLLKRIQAPVNNITRALRARKLGRCSTVATMSTAIRSTKSNEPATVDFRQTGDKSATKSNVSATDRRFLANVDFVVSAYRA